MEELERKIQAEGHVYPGGVLKVDGFLNHRIDTVFLAQMGAYIAQRFSDSRVDKVLTIEASGIALAFAAAERLKVPVVFAKKQKTSNMSADVFSSVVHSFTHNTDNHVVVSREYLCSGERILIVDDFLAEGNAIHGLMEIASKAGCEVVGCAVAIEKGFQGGGDTLRAQGVDVLSLAIIDSMSDTGIVFRKQDK